MTDETAMQLALAEARCGVGLTSPNPPVGAVIIGTGGKVLGAGWHQRAGGPHAEIEALRSAGEAGESVEGATVFVTLEPCSTQGRTPPCVDALIAARVGRVVWGAVDPNPAHLGRAAELLSAAGISVAWGVCQKECEALLRPFTKYIRTGIPWVTAKSGISLDGRITRPAGEGRWITSPEARQDAMTLRLHSDAILVGAGTVRADNPSLTLRGITVPDWKPQPWRVVLTRRGDVPFSAKVLTDSHLGRTLIFSSPLPELLQDLGSRGVMSVLIEGGGEVLASAFAAGVVDDVVFYTAPLISGSGLPVVNGTVFSGSAVELDFQEVRPIGPDLRIHALVRKGQEEASP